MTILSLQHELALWSLLFLYVPLIARRLQRLPGLFRWNHPADGLFFVAFVLVAWCVPRREQTYPALPIAAGVIATIGVSSTVGLLYVALVPGARHVAKPLLMILFVIDLAGLGIIHASVISRLSSKLFFLLLPILTGCVGWGSVRAALRMAK
jgi:hypothetical protein